MTFTVSHTYEQNQQAATTGLLEHHEELAQGRVAPAQACIFIEEGKRNRSCQGTSRLANEPFSKQNMQQEPTGGHDATYLPCPDRNQVSLPQYCIQLFLRLLSEDMDLCPTRLTCNLCGKALLLQCCFCHEYQHKRVLGDTGVRCCSHRQALTNQQPLEKSFFQGLAKRSC